MKEKVVAKNQFLPIFRRLRATIPINDYNLIICYRTSKHCHIEELFSLGTSGTYYPMRSLCIHRMTEISNTRLRKPHDLRPPVYSSVRLFVYMSAFFREQVDS